MYLFEAVYQNMDTGEEVTRTIEFDGGNIYQTEKECFIYAMHQAYNMKHANECLSNLEFIGC